MIDLLPSGIIINNLSNPADALILKLTILPTSTTKLILGALRLLKS